MHRDANSLLKNGEDEGKIPKQVVNSIYVLVTFNKMNLKKLAKNLASCGIDTACAH